MANDCGCTVPFNADMTERAVQIMQRKRRRTELRNQIVRDTREFIRLHDRNAELYQALGLHQYTSPAQMLEWQREMWGNLPVINTKLDGLKLLLAELDRLEADK
jgi:hypothetical protein